MGCRMKYHNRKITRDGENFDSVKEFRRFQELKLLEMAGVIKDLKRQVKFELIPSQKVDGKVAERPVNYVADFVYEQGGKTVVEDVKGVRTREYILKRKMMLYFHRIRIQEV